MDEASFGLGFSPLSNLEKASRRKSSKRSPQRKNEQKDASVKPEPKGAKFSDLLTSPIVTVTVGLPDQHHKTFLLHEELLCRESDKFQKQLNGDFKEAAESAIPNIEEDPEVFGYFVEYLYRDGWISQDSSSSPIHESEYVVLAHLYCMGERLLAPVFQKAVFWKLTRNFASVIIPDQETCDLLEIVCSELPERTPREDPLRALVFWHAASKLSRLQKYARFAGLLEEVPELGRYLCMRAGDGNASNPPLGRAEQPQHRFEREGTGY